MDLSIFYRDGPLTPVVHTVTLFVVACAVFANSASNGFVFDDLPAIVNNHDVHTDKSDFYGLWKNNFWGQLMGDPRSQHLSYRPLTIWTFRMNYWSVGLDPWLYHVMNVVLNAIAAILFYFVCRRLHGYNQTPAIVSLLAALVFAIHPVHVEAIANIVGRAEILAAIFFMASFLTYAKAAETSIVLIIPSVLLTSAAMLCKEQGITVVAMCLSWDVLYHLSFDPRTMTFGSTNSLGGFWTGKVHRLSDEKKQQIIAYLLTKISSLPKFKNEADNDQLSRLASELQSLVSKSKFELRPVVEHYEELISYLGKSIEPETKAKLDVNKLLQSVCRMVLYAGGVFLCFQERLKLNRDDVITVDEKTNPANHIENFELRALTKFYYCVLHYWLLIYPFELCCDWSSFGITNIESFEDPRNFASIVFACGIAYLVSLFWLASGTQQSRAKVTIAFVLTFAPFIPASGLFLEVGFVVAERVMYTPVAGMAFYLSLFLWRQWRWFSKLAHSSSPWSPKSMMLGFIFLLLISFSTMSVRRNKDWESERSLYESGIVMMPNNAKLHHNYAHSISGDKFLSHAAEFHYQEAMRIYPPYASAYINLGVLHANSGRLQDAVDVWKKGYVQWKKRPILGSDPLVLTGNLGTALANLGQNKEAIVYLKLCLQYNPNESRCAKKLREVQT